MPEPYRLIDEHGLPLCGICLDGIMFPRVAGYTSGSDGKRWYQWSEKPPQDLLDELEAYLANPVCYVGRHSWYEQRQIREARERAEQAAEELREIADRRPGWSITS